MKVLLINSVCKTGSTGKITYDLYEQIRKNGDDAAICYGRGSLVEGENIYCFAPQVEVYFHAFMTRLTGLTGCFSPVATHQLIRFIDKYKPDVIHIHELHSYFVNLKPLMEYIKRKSIKTIWTFHCEYMYTGKCGYSYECENWTNECGHCPQLKNYPRTEFFDFTRRMFLQKKQLFDKYDNLIIVTPSQWLADRVGRSFLAKKKIAVIHNGIDIENIFHPRTYEHLQQQYGLTSEKIVLAVAPDILSQRKGGRHVLKLAEKLANENIKFILIGIQDLTEKFPANVIAIGRTENQFKLAEYYSMADGFIICSEKENFPTTCIEALCCGTPVCGFDVGGTRETAPDGFGEFVKYGDISALSNAVMKMLKTENCSRACEEYGRNNYSRAAMYEGYQSLYLN